MSLFRLCWNCKDTVSKQTSGLSGFYNLFILLQWRSLSLMGRSCIKDVSAGAGPLTVHSSSCVHSFLWWPWSNFISWMFSKSVLCSVTMLSSGVCMTNIFFSFLLSTSQRTYALDFLLQIPCGFFFLNFFLNTMLCNLLSFDYSFILLQCNIETAFLGCTSTVLPFTF